MARARVHEGKDSRTRNEEREGEEGIVDLFEYSNAGILIAPPTCKILGSSTMTVTVWKPRVTPWQREQFQATRSGSLST